MSDSVYFFVALHIKIGLVDRPILISCNKVIFAMFSFAWAVLPSIAKRKLLSSAVRHRQKHSVSEWY